MGQNLNDAIAEGAKIHDKKVASWIDKAIEKQKCDAEVVCPNCDHHFVNPLIEKYNA